jgi:hypothetical protein
MGRVLLCAGEYFVVPGPSATPRKVHS